MEQIIIGLFIGVFLLLIQILYSRFKEIPRLTIELKKYNLGHDIIGTSPKNKAFTKVGHVDGNNSLKLFNLIYQFEIIITNNSGYHSYYPFIKTNDKLSLFKIREDIPNSPIESNKSITLTAKLNYEYERNSGSLINHESIINDLMKNFEIEVTFENKYKAKFCTIYEFHDKSNRHIKM